LTRACPPRHNSVLVESLRDLREKRALSLIDLSNLSKVSVGTIWRLEHQIGTPKPSTRRKLAKALGVEPWEIAWPKGRSKGR
jgi:transcriptional regulator with XRE-family HTH domain